MQLSENAPEVLFVVFFLFFIDVFPTDPPNGSPTITVEQGSLVFYESDDIKAHCEIHDGLPSANMSWIFTPVQQITNNVTMVDKIKRISFKKKANRTMDRERLICKVHHMAWLDNPERISQTEKLTIFCK